MGLINNFMKKYIWIFTSAALLETLIFPLRGLYLPTCPYLGHTGLSVSGSYSIFPVNDIHVTKVQGADETFLHGSFFANWKLYSGTA